MWSLKERISTLTSNSYCTSTPFLEFDMTVVKFSNCSILVHPFGVSVMKFEIFSFVVVLGVASVVILATCQDSYLLALPQRWLYAPHPRRQCLWLCYWIHVNVQRKHENESINMNISGNIQEWAVKIRNWSYITQKSVTSGVFVQRLDSFGRIGNLYVGGACKKS